MPAGLRPSPPDHFSAYKQRHANGALKIRLAFDVEVDCVATI